MLGNSLVASELSTPYLIEMSLARTLPREDVNERVFKPLTHYLDYWGSSCARHYRPSYKLPAYSRQEEAPDKTEVAALQQKVEGMDAKLNKIENQTSEDTFRNIVRQEIDRFRKNRSKPNKRRPALSVKAIRLAMEKWITYCHNPSAVGCDNGCKVKYEDVYNAFCNEFEKVGISDITDFRRAIESSRKRYPKDWKNLSYRRPYGQKRKRRQEGK